MTEQKKIDGRTKRALDMAIARKQVSQESYHAVLAGQIDLATAKAIGRNGTPARDASPGHSGQDDATGRVRSGSGADDAHTPPQPVSRISKDDRTPTKTPCLCGCGELVTRTFAPGHDMVMFRVAREHLTEGRELTKKQREYLESSGKMERVRERLAQEDDRRREAEARKSARKGG